jgi:hypothetical protein
MFDIKCAELAEAFLEDEDPAVRRHRDRLAQVIQDAIEAELEMLREIETRSAGQRERL